MFIHFLRTLFILKTLWSTVMTEVTDSENQSGLVNVFTGVLNNITRVNKAMENLIKNYEMLQTFYDTQETFESLNTEDYFSGETRYKTETTKQKLFSKKLDFPATKMDFIMYSSKETKPKGNNINEYKNPIFRNRKATPKILAFHVNGNLDDILIGSNVKHEKHQNSVKHSHKDKSKKLSLFKNHLNLSKEKETKMASQNEDSKKRHSSANEIDTKEDKDESSNKNRQSYWANKMWINVDPEKLKARHKQKKSHTDIKKHIIAPMLEDDDLSREDSASLTLGEESSLSVEMMNKNMLRYGDACLKLVIRKCHKAIKSALKEVCSVSRCKSRVKSQVKKCAKSNCITKFSSTGKTNTERKNEEITEDDKKEFIDITRQGYLATYCMTETRNQEKSDETQNLSNQTYKSIIRENFEVNILRDKYEKACAKVSKKKCKKACIRSFKEACTELTCKKYTRKKYKKSCKRHCKIMFSQKYSSKTKSGESDDEESDASGSDDDDDDSDDSS